jgi:hypothetical protein
MNNINAVKMVRDIRDKMSKELKGKTGEEINEYYKKHSEWAFKKETKKLKQKV